MSTTEAANRAEVAGVLLPVSLAPVPEEEKHLVTLRAISGIALPKHTALLCSLVLFLFPSQRAKQILHAAPHAPTLAASGRGRGRSGRRWCYKQALFIGVEINNYCLCICLRFAEKQSRHIKGEEGGRIQLLLAVTRTFYLYPRRAYTLWLLLGKRSPAQSLVRWMLMGFSSRGRTTAEAAATTQQKFCGESCAHA